MTNKQLTQNTAILTRVYNNVAPQVVSTAADHWCRLLSQKRGVTQRRKTGEHSATGAAIDTRLRERISQCFIADSNC